VSFSCPLCGTPLAERPAPAALVGATPFSAFEMKIVHAVLPEFGQFITRARLRNRVFGESRKKPQAARDQKLASGLLRVNQKLSARGLVIEHVRGDRATTSHRLTWIVEHLKCERCAAVYPAGAKYRSCTCGGRLVPLPLVQPTGAERPAPEQPAREAPARMAGARS
jgi:hypothetical protein